MITPSLLKFTIAHVRRSHYTLENKAGLLFSRHNVPLPMKKNLKTNIHLAYRIIVIQVLAVLAVGFFVFSIQGIQNAYSILLGGAACILPNLYFAHRFLYPNVARSYKRILISFFQGEIIKFGLTILLFWLMMRYLSVSFLSLFIGYFSAQVGFWIAPLLLSRRQIKTL